jgi:HEAT repeat protein
LIGGKEGLELGRLTLTHADPKVRRAGVFGLWRAHGEQALPSLEQALDDADAAVRGRTVEGLGNLGGDKARDLIRMQLTREKDAGVLKSLKDAEAQMKK